MDTKFPSLPSPPNLASVFTKFAHGAKPLLQLHDTILREDSPLTVSERELIAAHVSGLNACGYCYAAHTTIAEAYGIDAGIFEAMQEDVATAGVPEKLKPILAYVTKLTRTPSKVTATDAKAVYDAGWDEHALYDAIAVCALFNFMNRIVEGTGCSVEAKTSVQKSGGSLDSYVDWGREAGFID